jgi:4-diphosphocytidyl-2-C-methyl-D-erythritol kinase
VSVPLRLDAPAKLNLDLRVVGRRPDGYHELESTLVLVDLADRLLLMPGCSGLRLEGAGGADLPLDESNLAWRGLEAGLGGSPDLACLALEKRIPIAAGLGGGSSDAAAAWRLGRAWLGRDDLAGPDDLLALVAIGADVPFFAAGVAAARVAGIGERIEAVDPAAVAHEVVLVHPPFGLSTAAVFAELRPAEWGTDRNDLEAPARRLRPELDDVFARVRAAGAEPRMTGSGPTIFALDDDPARADALAATLAADGLRVTRTTTRPSAARIESIDEPPEEENDP